MFKKVDLSLRTNNTKWADTSKEPLTWSQFPLMFLLCCLSIGCMQNVSTDKHACSSVAKENLRGNLSYLLSGWEQGFWGWGWFIFKDLFTYINKPLSNFLLLIRINLPSECNLCEELGADLVFTKKDSQWNKNSTTGGDVTQFFFYHQKWTNVRDPSTTLSEQASLFRRCLKIIHRNLRYHPLLQY